MTWLLSCKIVDLPLNLQVSIYKEDFHSERSDRERAQAELLVAKEERDNLKQAITVMVSGLQPSAL